jgi:hypothetical protein
VFPTIFDVRPRIARNRAFTILQSRGYFRPRSLVLDGRSISTGSYIRARIGAASDSRPAPQVPRVSMHESRVRPRDSVPSDRRLRFDTVRRCRMKPNVHCDDRLRAPSVPLVSTSMNPEMLPIAPCLYVVFLGGDLAGNRLGEDHEVVLAVADNINDARSNARAKWTGHGKAHVDAVRTVRVVDGYAISLNPSDEPDSGELDTTYVAPTSE